MIKKPEGLYRLESYRYFKAALTSPVKRRQQPLYYFAFGFFVGFVLIYTLSTSSCIVTMAMIMLSLLAYSSTLSVGEYLRNTPSLATLMPVSGKKKLLYRFTSSLYMYIRILLYVAIGIAIFFIVSLIIALISVAVEYGSVSIDGGGGGASAEDYIPVLMGKYGAIFSVAFIIICFSAGVISGYFKKSRNRNLFMLGFTAVVIVSFVLTGIPYLTAHRASHMPLYMGARIVSPFIEDCYKFMALPWLCSLLWCLAAAGSLVAAVYMGIRKMKASEY